MAADPEMWKAFIRHLEKMITELRDELAPYKDGTTRVKRVAGGESVDITDARIAQIGREIEALESAVKRHSGDHA